MEGPVNICIICNRCLYARSILRIRQAKYEMNTEEGIAQQKQICRTCDLFLKKKKIPSQVSSKI